MKQRQCIWLLGLLFCAAHEVKQSPASDAATIEKNTRLQIFLDEANFGPGKIDGRNGEFTRKAFERYKKALGLGSGSQSAYAPPSGLNEVDTSKIDPVFVDYTVSKEDAAAVVDLPAERTAQAKLQTLGYRNLLEAIAERFHADVDFVKELNPGLKTDALKDGAVLKVPNVKAFELKAVKTIKPAAEADKFNVRISTKENGLEVREGDKVRAFFPITSGSDSLPAPIGEWKVEGVATLPDFRYDKKMLQEGRRSDDFVMLPPGPNNPVGVVWIRLNKDGIGIHGTDDPDTIGRSASHGCIRLANWDIVKLAALVKAGTPVTIE